MKVVYLPLDERPCNLKYPQQLANMTEINIAVPSRSILGDKKTPAHSDEINKWLDEEATDADYLIVSLDMLVYGGIVPSRLHSLSFEDGVQRLQTLKIIKERYKNIRIFAFNLIMRVPAYNSNDEEPDYYETYGERISNYGKLVDKEEQGELTEWENGELILLKELIPGEVLSDFIGRRKVNSAVNLYSIDLVDEGIIDYLIIPLDDNAAYGFSSKEQRELVLKVDELNLMDQVAIYPGADEIGCTLFAKVFCEVKQYVPSIFVRYSSTMGPYIIPKYEDRSLFEGIKANVTAIGAVIIDSSQDADALLMVHSPAVGQSDVAEPTTPCHKRHRSYFSEVNIREFVQAMRYYINQGKVVALADVATCNGSDISLVKLLKKTNLIDRIEAYAGWNTSGNTIGTALAHGVIESFYQKRGKDKQRRLKSREFYYSRLVEDWGYQTIVRPLVTERDVPRLGGTYFNITGAQDEIEAIICDQLNQFIEMCLNPIGEGRLQLQQVHMPWNRMFEIGFQLNLIELE